MPALSSLNRPFNQPAENCFEKLVLINVDPSSSLGGLAMPALSSLNLPFIQPAGNCFEKPVLFNVNPSSSLVG